MGPLGVPEMIFLFVLALLILGPKKLPELGRSIGKGMAEFRRASNELRGTFEREMRTMEQETSLSKDVLASSGSTDYSSYDEDPYSSTTTTSSVSAPQAAESQPVPNPEGKGSEVTS